MPRINFAIRVQHTAAGRFIAAVVGIRLVDVLCDTAAGLRSLNERMKTAFLCEDWNPSRTVELCLGDLELFLAHCDGAVHCVVALSLQQDMAPHQIRGCGVSDCVVK